MEPSMTDLMTRDSIRNAVEEIKPMLAPYLNGLALHMYPAGEGFSVRLKEGDALILAAGKTEALRALCALASAVQSGKENFFLEQQTPFATRGVMYDCSRNSVPRVDTIKMLMRRMALMGLNTLMLYTEDTYTSPAIPAMGHFRGGYSQQEIKDLDDYADLLGIELIPCIQTLAHLERLLRWRVFDELKDDKDTLYVGKEETYALLKKMILAASAPVRSRRIHLGLDEAHGLGRGLRLDQEGYRSKVDLMTEHLARVEVICRELGLSPMMWGDMLFRINIRGNGYYDENVVLPEHMASVIPKEYQVVYWDYYHIQQSFYDHYIHEHQKLGIQPVFAGGVCSWLGMQPNLIKSKASIRAGLAACRSAGIREIFTTVWRDDGGEGMPGAVIPGIQMFAESAWEERADVCDRLTNLHSRLAAGMTGEQIAALGSIDELQQGLSLTGLEAPNPQKYFLWQDPLLGLFDVEAATGDYAEFYRGKAAELASLCGGEAEAADALLLAEKLSEFLSLKVDLGVRLKRAYDRHDRAALKAIARQIVSDILPSLHALHAEHRAMWLRWYKPFGWEAQDIRYGGLSVRLQYAADRVNAYADGTIDVVEELAVPRLTHTGDVPKGAEELPSIPLYRDIATVSAL